MRSPLVIFSLLTVARTWPRLAGFGAGAGRGAAAGGGVAGLVACAWVGVPAASTPTAIMAASPGWTNARIEHASLQLPKTRESSPDFRIIRILPCDAARIGREIGPAARTTLA